MVKPTPAPWGQITTMKAFTRSTLTALLIAASIFAFTYGVCGSRYSRMVVGSPAYAVERSIVHSALPTVRIKNDDGSVIVKTHTGNSMNLSADIKVYARTEEGEFDAAKYGETLVSIQDVADAVEVISEPAERPDDVDVLVEYMVSVPIGTNIEVTNASGNVNVDGGCGAVTVLGRNTDILISEPKGKVIAQSTNGRIRVLDAIQDASLETVNGSVFAHMLRGALKAKTTNGEIVAHVLKPDVQECDLTTWNGGITLVLANGCSAALEARTTHGVVKSDFDIESAEGVARRRHVRGTIGQGQTELQMSTLNGNIWIARSGL